MERHYPYLEVRGPDGQSFTAKLTETEISIGSQRGGLPVANDIYLEPDPAHLISRRHCRLLWEAGRWWLLDEGSANGTLVRRGGEEAFVTDKEPILDGDVILILGRVTTDGDTTGWWELTFRDPHKTVVADPSAQAGSLVYDPEERQLVHISNVGRKERIVLTPQENCIIRYMDAKNRKHGKPVPCSAEELLEAVWDEEDRYGRTIRDVHGLVYRIRVKIEANPQQPRYLERVDSRGYRLITHPRLV